MISFKPGATAALLVALFAAMSLPTASAREETKRVTTVTWYVATVVTDGTIYYRPTTEEICRRVEAEFKASPPKPDIDNVSCVEYTETVDKK